MKPTTLLFSFLLLTLHLPSFPCAAQEPAITLENGDRVVFIGDGFFESEIDYGYLEYVLTTAWPTHRVTFRNIGWSADTPRGTSRDHFTNPPTAYDHLIEQIRSTNPSVAFIGYGGHLAFESPEAIPEFTSDMYALLDTLKEMEVKPVLLSPPPHDPNTSPAPNVNSFNEQLARVSSAIAKIARDRSLAFVNVYDALIGPANDPNLHIATNGFQLNAHGYYLAGLALAQKTGVPMQLPQMTIDVKNPASTPQMKNLKATPEDVSYRLHAHRLPIPRPSESDSFITPQSLRVTGLKRGNYNILIDNKTVATVSARALAQGVEISLPFGPQVEELIQLIYKKNRTFFHQYRPQNETYLVGFREYEQGQNARELALLNPLIGQIENEIGRLRIPRDVSVHIVAE